MFDYIIVGAGSAGCVLANRLSADPRVRVLLLEAGGPDRQREIRIPAAFPKLFKSKCDWAFYTEEQSHLLGRKLYWPRGKVLGGSSSINAMIYIRGNCLDYDHWRSMGNDGWGYEDVLPYFKRAEDQQRGASAFHGVGGPLRVEDLRTVNPLSRVLVEAGVELGVPFNPDFNGPQQEGVGFYQVTQKRGRRHSAADAYLKPALKRRNLTIRSQARATRLLFAGKRVAGVEFKVDTALIQERAAREVILCAGTIQSPQILMLSGIGPPASLEARSVRVAHDLPGVGKNLQDHLFLPVCYESIQPVSLDKADTLTNFLRYLAFKRGPLTSNIAEAGGFLKLRSDLPAPNLQILFGPVFYLDHGFTRPEGCGFSIGPALLQPASRGAISLRSANPMDFPVIQPNYLTSDSDLCVLVEGIKFARRLAHTKAFEPFRGREFCPESKVQTDEALATYVRQVAETMYHPVGTCRMGNDAMAVVDSHLRVRDIEGLRVADASVMPSITRGNTNAPTIMIAEKAADLILRA